MLSYFSGLERKKIHKHIYLNKGYLESTIFLISDVYIMMEIVISPLNVRKKYYESNLRNLKRIHESSLFKFLDQIDLQKS